MQIGGSRLPAFAETNGITESDTGISAALSIGRLGSGSPRLLLAHAIRRVAVRMTNARPAGAGASAFVITAVRASAQTGLTVCCHAHGGRGLLVAFRGGGMGLRRGHGSLGGGSGAGQGRGQQRGEQDTEHKAHEVSPWCIPL